MAWKWRLPFAPDPVPRAKVDEMVELMVRGHKARLDEERAGKDPASAADRLAALATLAAGYGKNPFTEGQLVTRRPNTGGHGAGSPHVVLEVLPEGGEIQFLYEEATVTPSNDPDYGARYDMRVLHESTDGQMHAHWVESYLYEPWAEPEEWKPLDDPAPEQFEGPWANMPDLGDIDRFHFGIGLDPRQSASAVWPAAEAGPEVMGVGAIIMPPGASGLINKFEPGRPIELEPGIFGIVIATPEGQAQRVATSSDVVVRWLGGWGSGIVYWDEESKAFNSEGRGIIMAGWTTLCDDNVLGLATSGSPHDPPPSPDHPRDLLRLPRRGDLPAILERRTMSRNHLNSEAFRREEAAMTRRLDARPADQHPCRDRTQQCGHYGECLRCGAVQGDDRCAA